MSSPEIEREGERVGLTLRPVVSRLRIHQQDRLGWLHENSDRTGVQNERVHPGELAVEKCIMMISGLMSLETFSFCMCACVCVYVCVSVCLAG